MLTDLTGRIESDDRAFVPERRHRREYRTSIVVDILQQRQWLEIKFRERQVGIANCRG